MESLVEPVVRFRAQLASLRAQPFGDFNREARRGALAHRTCGQRVEKKPTVLFGQNTPVQDRNHAAIRCRPDKTTEPLPKSQDGFWDEVLAERIIVHLSTRSHDRIRWHIERQFWDE